jgi:hypothetical protein
MKDVHKWSPLKSPKGNYPAIAIAEAEGPHGDEHVAREVQGRKRSECNGGRANKARNVKEEEDGGASWRTATGRGCAWPEFLRAGRVDWCLPKAEMGRRAEAGGEPVRKCIPPGVPYHVRVTGFKSAIRGLAAQASPPCHAG